MPHNRKPGFTLVELLVVVTIIVALLAILGPAMKGASQTAQLARCLAQQRQLSVGWSGYASDNFGRLWVYTWTSERDNGPLWTEMLRERVSNVAEVLTCPGTDNPPGLTDRRSTAAATGSGFRFGTADSTWMENRNGKYAAVPFDRASYTYNRNMCPESRGATGHQYKSFNDIGQHGQAPVLGDGVWREANTGYPRVPKYFPGNPSDPEGWAWSTLGNDPAIDKVYRYATNRHGAVTGILFADGHVEAVELPGLWHLKWHKAYDTQTPAIGAP